MLWLLGTLCLLTCGVLLYVDRWAFRSALSLFFGLLFLYLAAASDIPSISVKRGMFLLMCGCIPVCMAIISILLLYNGAFMLRKEGRKPKHLLCLLFGFIIPILSVADAYVTLRKPGTLGFCIFAYIHLLFLYLTVFFVAFSLYTIVCLLVPKRGRYDFIVVLGAGLCGKRVTPLLARRLDKARTYYDKGGRQARLVVSGGQGADEEVPEAAAMRDYLKEKGVKREMILMEDRSVNTFENMKYSKRIMDAHKEDYRCLFVTNDFHVVRSGMHARRVGLGNARGAGCRTAAYYWPSAFIREYLAMLARYQWEAAAYAVMCFPITALFLL